MRVLALDLSLRATGWATNVPLRRQPSYGVFGAEDETGYARIRSIRSDCNALAEHVRPDLVVFEGLVVFRGNAVLQLAGLGYMVRCDYDLAGYQLFDIPPSTLKKFATGRGHAEKSEMITAARLYLGYDGFDDNEADALWLLQSVLQHYRLDGAAELPPNRRDALAGVRWPNPLVNA